MMIKDGNSNLKAKNITVGLIVPILILLFLESCTFQKRTFRKGYHVEWNIRHANKSSNNPIEKSEPENLQIAEISNADSPKFRIVDSTAIRTLVPQNMANQIKPSKQTSISKNPNIALKANSTPTATIFFASKEHYQNTALPDKGENIELIWFALVVPIVVIAAVLYGVSPGAAATGVGLYIILVIIAIAVLTVIAMLIFTLLKLIIDGANEMK
ncbi:MAG: hypothetical protein ACK4WD_14130 [Flavobacteriales bacterium]|jgi:hypothetical protein